MSPRTIAVVSAGLSQPSSTRLLAGKLAAATAGQLPAGTRVITIELRDLAHDIVNALLTGFPSPALREAIEQVLRADGLIAVPRCTAAPTTGCSSRSWTYSTRARWRARRCSSRRPAARPGTRSRWSMRSGRCSPTCAVTVPTAVFAATEDWGAADGSGEALTAGLPHRPAQPPGQRQHRIWVSTPPNRARARRGR